MIIIIISDELQKKSISGKLKSIFFDYFFVNNIYDSLILLNSL